MRFFVLITLFICVGFEIFSEKPLLQEEQSEKIAPIVCSAEEYQILERFFRIVVEDDGVGWVLFGSKPLCNIEVHELDSIAYGHGVINDKCAKIAGFQVIEKFNIDSPESNLLYVRQGEHCKDTDVFFINRKLLSQTIRENFHFFQMVLGPLVNEKELLQALCESGTQRNFYKVLRENRLLYGILFGFGSENALLESRRMALLRDDQLLTEIPQIFPGIQLAHLSPSSKDDNFNHFFFINRNEYRDYLATKDSEESCPLPLPGLGYESVEQELEELEKRSHIFLLSFRNETRALAFGYCDSSESRALINRYEEDYKKIQKLLQRPDFTEHLFSAFFGRELICKEKKNNTPLSLEKEDFSELYARLVMQPVKDLDPRVVDDYLSGFISGTVNPVGDWGMRMLPFLDRAERNLLETKKHFDILQNKHDLEIVPQALYAETLEKGPGEQLNTPDAVIASYTISDLEGRVLVHEIEKKLDLLKTIPGFCYGMRGMQIGERRKIHIHPSLGYGLFIAEIPCTSLIVDVTLHNIFSSSKAAWPDLTPLSLVWIEDATLKKEIETEAHKDAFDLGARFRERLSSLSNFDAPAVMRHLSSLRSQTHHTVLSESELNLLNKVYWNHLYTNQKL